MVVLILNNTHPVLESKFYTEHNIDVIIKNITLFTYVECFDTFGKPVMAIETKDNIKVDDTVLKSLFV